MIDARFTGLLLLGALGCGDASSEVFVSESFEIEPSDNDVVCRGALEDIEAQFERVKNALARISHHGREFRPHVLG